MERTNTVTMKGNPITLSGPELKVGDKAPDFLLHDNSLQPVKLSDSAGKVRFLSVVPSLDTPVCNIQTNKFNQGMSALGDKVKSYTISADLPFAQARFCGEHKIENMQTLSDHRSLSFGQAYGLAIKDLRLLSRAVIVVDDQDKIAYFQTVPEVTAEPNYTEALDAVKRILG
ncbi:MAG: thiol peroxidase [bacterium]